MPKYLHADRIRDAVENLRNSRATTGGTVNFLIFKRAMVLSAKREIALSLQDVALQQAITELTLWCDTGKENGLDEPFLDVFGSSTDSSRMGFRKQSYRSNGAADTVKSEHWSNVFEVKGKNPKTARLKNDYINFLSGAVLVKDERRLMPSLLDAAIWYWRKDDIEGIVGNENDAVATEGLLAEGFIKRLGLTPDEISCLFGK